LIAPLTALLLQSVLVGAAALLAPRARAVAIVLGFAAFLGPPWLAGDNALLRGLAALLGWVELLRIADVARVAKREKWNALRRIVHVASFVDTRSLTRAPPSVDIRAIARALLWGALAAAAFFSLTKQPLVVVKWAAGLVFAYATIEAGYALASGVLYRSLGFITPPLHVWPLASLSIGELWGVRWARPISTWLREHCLRPFARRRRPMLGLFIGFLVSAIGHAYPVLVALADHRPAAMMFAFFFLQGLFVLIETRLGITRWPRPVRRLWTVTLMIASSPLFVEPALRVLR
jgi:hypothetical protein